MPQATPAPNINTEPFRGGAESPGSMNAVRPTRASTSPTIPSKCHNRSSSLGQHQRATTHRLLRRGSHISYPSQSMPFSFRLQRYPARPNSWCGLFANGNVCISFPNHTNRGRSVQVFVLLDQVFPQLGLIMRLFFWRFWHAGN